MTATTINLESLLDLSAKLVESNDVEYILNAALLSLMGKLRVTRACALVPNGSGLLPLIQKGKVNRQHFSSFVNSTLFDCTEDHPELYEEGFVICAPVHSKGELRGAIVLGRNIGAVPYDETERHYASLVSMIAANALQSAQHVKNLVAEKSRVESRNQLLESLFEMSNDLGSLFTRDQILQIFSFRLMGQVMVSRFALLLFARDGNTSIAFNRFNAEFPSALLNDLQSIRESTRVGDWPGKPEQVSVLKSFGAELLSPLLVKNELRGVLIVGRKLIGEFGEFEVRFVEALGSTLATALENVRLFEEEVDKKRIEGELDVARQIQHKLFPESLPIIVGMEIAAKNLASQQVGGDYFDVIRIDDNRVLLAIADVSGKGMPASILMANMQAALRVLAPLVRDMPDLVARLNDLLYENTGNDKFVTFFGAHLDTAERTLYYTNAGHNPPMLFRSVGSIEELSEGGLILGVMPVFRPYNCGKVFLHSGDVLVLFTDGVNEAMDQWQREFGDENIRRVVREHINEGAEDILEVLLKEVQLHALETAQSDDITLLVLKVL